MPRSLAFPLAFLVFTTPALAQSIRVRTVETETGRPIAGAIVVLLDSAGRRVIQGLTNEAGRIVFTPSPPGTYRLKADRIGHPGTVSDYFHSTTTESITLEMSAVRFELPELAVSGTSECRRESEETAQLWEEIRKALYANEATSTSGSVPLIVRKFVRYRSLSGTLRSDSTTDTFTTRLSPFVSEEPDSLFAKGFIHQVNGNYRFLGPDAALLLSDGFLETHCFRVARPDRGMPGKVGLGFEPVKGRKLPEIKGVLWVDRATAELTTLVYEYVNIPSAVRTSGLGGRIEFARMTSGAWFIRDWYIRAPDRVDFQGRVAARRPVASVPDSIVGFIDVGGTAQASGDASVLLTESVSRTSQASVVLRDVTIRVMSNDGRPIEGALIAVAELDTTITTGAGGEARLNEVTGPRLRIRVRAIGFTPVNAAVTLDSDRRIVDTSITLTAQAQRLAPLVVTESAPVVSGKMAGFERRRKEGFGYFLDQAALDNPLLGTLDKQLRQIGRVWIVSCNSRLLPASRTAGTPANDKIGCGVERCFMTVYVDGALYFSPSAPSFFDLANYPLHTLQAVEVYPSIASLPVEYNATGSSCGVILLWTK